MQEIVCLLHPEGALTLCGKLDTYLPFRCLRYKDTKFGNFSSNNIRVNKLLDELHVSQKSLNP